MVSGCGGFPRDFALTFGSSWPSTARFVRKSQGSFKCSAPVGCQQAEDAVCISKNRAELMASAGIRSSRHARSQSRSASELLATLRKGE